MTFVSSYFAIGLLFAWLVRRHYGDPLPVAEWLLHILAWPYWILLGLALLSTRVKL